jgi:hypothetical protein
MGSEARGPRPRARRTVAGVILSMLLAIPACKTATGSYTKQHCDAFSQRGRPGTRRFGNELLALTSPPDGETVEPAVHDAALRLAAGSLGVQIGGQLTKDERVKVLLAECAKVTPE